jgi:NitT/TauT family transport system substrate-binding protein
MRPLVALLTAALVLAPGAVRAQSPPAAPTTIRIAAAPDDDVTPLLYAQRAGLFRAAGIALDLERVAGGAAATTAVTAGAADVGLADLVPLISAHSRGIPVILIAPAGIYAARTPPSGILVLKDSPIRSARDLAGKTISAPGLRGLSWLGTNAWIDANGGDAKAVRFVEVPAPLVAAALDAGRIDVGTLANPSFAEDMASGKYRVIGHYVEAIGTGILQTAWFTTAGYGAKNRDALELFTRVVHQAGEYTNRHHDETVDLLAAYSGLDPATIRHMDRGVAGTALDPALIQPLIDAAAKYKLIEKPFPAQEFAGLPG